MLEFVHVLTVIDAVTFTKDPTKETNFSHCLIAFSFLLLSTVHSGCLKGGWPLDRGINNIIALIKAMITGHLIGCHFIGMQLYFRF